MSTYNKLPSLYAKEKQVLEPSTGLRRQLDIVTKN